MKENNRDDDVKIKEVLNIIDEKNISDEKNNSIFSNNNQDLDKNDIKKEENLENLPQKSILEKKEEKSDNIPQNNNIEKKENKQENIPQNDTIEKKENNIENIPQNIIIEKEEEKLDNINQNKKIEKKEDKPDEVNQNIIIEKKEEKLDDINQNLIIEKEKEKLDKINKNSSIEKKEIINKEAQKNTKKNYNQIIKDYIAKSSQDPEYDEKINTDPLSLFDSIDEQKIKFWESTLYKLTPNTKKISNDKEHSILSNLVEIKDVKVIRNDCKRTRVRESVIYPNFKETLEKLLIFYCYKYKATYKQGLNEIFGPLLLMQYKLKKYSLVSIINLGARLIDVFLPNYFYEKEIYSLKSAFGLFILLLKYHEPTVYNKLDKSEIKPEIYATNWLVNYMSGKMSLNCFFELWDQMINIKDPLFIQFILVALIKNNREMIINCEENYLAGIMTCLTIRSKEELVEANKTALELREKTPYSFRILANKIGFLRKNNKEIKENYEKYQPETIPAMPIFPAEVLFITYKNEIDCIDSRCINYIKNLEKVSPDFRLRTKAVAKRGESKTVKDKMKTYDYKYLALSDKNHLCEKCDMKIKKNMKYILLDLRILDGDKNDSAKTAFLPKMINVPQEELKSEDFSNIMTNRFITERGNYHLIFLTSATDTFANFENNYYKENISEEDRRKMMFGVIKQQTVDKELNIDNAMKELTLKQTYKLKEYDNLRKTLKSMTKHNFPYVGYVYGGFIDVHRDSKRFKVELLLHNKETCLLCNEKSKSSKSSEPEKEKKEEEKEKNELYKSLWEHKKKIKYKNLDIFFKNPNNIMHLCVLKEYRGENIEKEQVQILINELLDKFVIEIYKFDKQKQYIDFENTIQILDKKRKKEYYDLGADDIEDTIKDLELTLLEQISVVDIISIKADQNSNNIINVSIRDETKKESIFGIFKKKENIFIRHTIVFDFSSDKDSKNFIQSFKSLVNLYREKIKNK